MAVEKRDDLLKLTPEALAQLANIGLVKRAQRELAAGYSPCLDLQPDGTLIALFPDQVHSEFAPGTGLREARCSCGAALCRHRIAAVLHYAAGVEETPADAAPPVPQFADLDDAQIRAQTSAPLWPAVERELRCGIRIEVECSQSRDGRTWIHTARLPHATARYYAGADLAFARCDCAAQQRCEHIALGAMALLAAPALGEARITVNLGAVVDRALPADHHSAPYLQVFTALLRDGLAHGAAESPATAQALSRALQASRQAGAAWLTLGLETIEQWLEQYQQRSARFAYRDGLQQLRELSLRLAVAETGSALPPRAVLGLGEAMETALDRLSLVSLGLRLQADGGERRAVVAVVDCDTQTVLSLHKRWRRELNDPTSERAQLDQQRIAGTLRLSRLALGSLVTTTARRRANHELKLGQSFAGKASISAHNGDWSTLGAPLLIEDRTAWLRQQAHAAPTELLPRDALPGFYVLRVARVERVAFDPAIQRLHARLVDRSGAAWWLWRDHAAATPGALDAIARVLLQASDSASPLYVAGTVHRGPEGSAIEPWAMSLGRLEVPDLAAVDGSLATLPLAAAANVADDPLALWLAAIDDALCELLRDGVRRAAAVGVRLIQLSQRARELGLRKAEPLLDALSAQLRDDRDAEAAVGVMRDLLHWTALARHAVAMIDIEHALEDTEHAAV
jgi:hypothetical protein